MTQLKTWMEKPISDKTAKNVKIIYFLTFGLLCSILTSFRKMDVDSYYMIAQAREIIDLKGFPIYNNFTYYENFATCIQQWIYCMCLWVMDELPGNIWFILFAAVQQMILLYLFNKKLKQVYDDEFITYALASIICILIPGYFISLRPENITLIFILWECLCLDNYKKTNKTRYLYVLPFITLLEMNIHGSMWIFHFCVLAAYITPSLLKPYVKDNHIKINKHVIIVFILMIISLFINPYGFQNIMYPFSSLNTFNYIKITEQQTTAILTLPGILCLIAILLLFYGIEKQLIKSETFYMAAGLLFLSVTSYHSVMFIIIAYVFIFHDLLKQLATYLPKKCRDTMNNEVLIIIPPCILVISLTALIIMPPCLKSFKEPKAQKAVVEYIKEHDPNNEYAILNDMMLGSYLEYNGIKNIFFDSRPEMLNKNINGEYDAIYDFYYMAKNIQVPGCREYKNAKDYLDTYKIKYIAMRTNCTSYPVITAYIENSDEFELVLKTNFDEDVNYIIYERTEESCRQLQY